MPHLRGARLRGPRQTPPPEDPARPLPGPRRADRVPHPGPAARPARRRPRPGRRRRRGAQRHPRDLRGRLPPHDHRPPLPLHLARRRLRLRRLPLRDRRDRARCDAAARLPVRTGRLDGHRRDARGGLAGGGLRRDGPARIDRPLRQDLRPGAARPAPALQQLGVDDLPHGGQRPLVARQRRAARRRGPHRPLLHRLGHQAGRGGRAGAGRVPVRTARRARRAVGVRDRAQTGRRLHPAGREGEPGVVREPAPLPGPAAPPVRVQPAHPQPPGHPRQPPAARRPLHRVRGAGVRLPARYAPDVHAVPAARADPAQPGGGVRDGHVLRDRRRARRLPPRPPRRPRARRGGAGHDRDGVRERAGPHLPRLRRPLHRPADGGVAPHHRLRAPAGAGHRDRRPARPLGPQGLHQADVGGHGRPAAHGQLAARRTLAAAVQTRQPDPARSHPRPTHRHPRAVRRVGLACREGRLRPARTPLRPRLSALRLPVTAHQPPHGRLRRLTGEAAALPTGGLRRRPHRVAGRPPDDGPHLRHRLGGRGHDGRGRGRDRPRLRRPRRGRDRRLHGPGRLRRTARLRPLLPDPLRRPDPPRGGRPGDRRRRHLLLGRRQLADPGGPRRPVRPGPPPPLRPPLDPPRGRRAVLHRPRRPLAGPLPRGQPPPPHGPHRHPETQAVAGRLTRVAVAGPARTARRRGHRAPGRDVLDAVVAPLHRAGRANRAPASRRRSCRALKTSAERSPGQAGGRRWAGRPGSV
ncbi:hypothetical protein SGPA1_11019 [Streptomyces misionensis JCM 4497]